jgi:hypothetical protein
MGGGGVPLHSASAKKAFLPRLTSHSPARIGSKKPVQCVLGLRTTHNSSLSSFTRRKQPDVIHRRCRQQQIVASSKAGGSPVTDSYDSFDSVTPIESPIDVEATVSLPQKVSNS